MSGPSNVDLTEAYKLLRRMTGAEPYAATVLPMARELCAVREAERERVLAAFDSLKRELAWDVAGCEFDSVSASDLDRLIAKLRSEP